VHPASLPALPSAVRLTLTVSGIGCPRAFAQAAGAGDEVPQLRLGGRLLAAELARVEADAHDAREAQAVASGEVLTLRSGLGESCDRNTALTDEVAGLQALLRAAQTAQAQDTSIDKRLVASVLVKYFERGSSDVLAVLASMLGCSPEEQQVLGLLPMTATSSEARPDAKLSDMWIVRAQSPLAAPYTPTRLPAVGAHSLRSMIVQEFLVAGADSGPASSPRAPP